MKETAREEIFRAARENGWGFEPGSNRIAFERGNRPRRFGIWVHFRSDGSVLGAHYRLSRGRHGDVELPDRRSKVIALLCEEPDYPVETMPGKGKRS